MDIHESEYFVVGIRTDNASTNYNMVYFGLTPGENKNSENISAGGNVSVLINSNDTVGFTLVKSATFNLSELEEFMQDEIPITCQFLGDPSLEDSLQPCLALWDKL